MRQVVVDTETTGLEIESGHRILEVGCVEIIGRRITGRHFHHYVNPQRDVDSGALEVHGITRDFLQDKPAFPDIWSGLLEFIQDAELIMHNADFDIQFLNQEMQLVSEDLGSITDYCKVIDSLALARFKHPGQKNSLDALCKRYNVDNSQRELHGALLDAEILADIYLLLTSGQVTLDLDEEVSRITPTRPGSIPADRPRLKVIHATEEELASHGAKLDQLDEVAEAGCVWKQLELDEPVP